MRRSIILAAAAVVATVAAGTASSFERDTHYYSTYALALTTCFDWEEAHLIASADVMVDGSHGTVAELNPTQRHNKVAWHAFGHSIERYYELWKRVLLEDREELRLIAFGQFLHFLQDWEAHAGYPVHLGHAKATILGHDPDSMARSEARTRHGIQATLDHMALLCREMDRLPPGIENPDQALTASLDRVVGKRLIRDLIEASDPGWRSTLKGGLTERGAHILAENVHLIEQYVLDDVAPLPSKNVPADFTPGSDAHGIPEPLEMAFDADGRLVNDLEVHLERVGLQPLDDHLDVADHHVRVAHARPNKHGWRIQIEATNTGDVAMPPGELLAVVVDAITEEHLGEAATTIPEVLPDQTHTVKLTVPTTRPTETALIGVSFASPHDRNRHNSDIWHMTAEDLDELNDHVAAYGHLHGFSTIPDDAALDIVAAPAAWVTSGGRLCVASVARGTTTDPSIHVEGPEYWLAGSGSAGVELESVFPVVWTITPSHPGELPAVKSYACFDLSEEVCGSIAGSAAGYRLDMSIALGEVRRSTSAELGPELDEKTRNVCRERVAAVNPAPPG